MTIVEKNKITKLTWFIHICLLILIIWVSVLYCNVLTFLDLTPLLSILQNTSALIFTIMGIWIAYLYPEAIIKIFNSSSEGSTVKDTAIVKQFPTGQEMLKKQFEKEGYKEHESRIKIIVGVVALSASVMVCLIIITIAYPLLKNGWIYQSFPSVIRGGGIFFILTLTYAQLFSIYIVIASNINFLRDITKLKNKIKLHKKLYPELYNND